MFAMEWSTVAISWVSLLKPISNKSAAYPNFATVYVLATQPR